ncbi:unnamed protein product [Effrenium voratum]|nr:unnamed protein product [Effrenium voratum]
MLKHHTHLDCPRALGQHWVVCLFHTSRWATSHGLHGSRDSCEVETMAKIWCKDVVDEIRARVTSASWHDPHNGGTYSFLDDSTDDVLQIQRVTANKKYTDKMTFTFTKQGHKKACAVHACSESQVFSIADFSTNYCNLRNLYCGSEDGCKPVRHDFSSEELDISPSMGAGNDKSACIAGATKDALVVDV